MDRLTSEQVIERANEMSATLGVTYGKLQNELLAPLVKRMFELLDEKGLLK